MNTVKSFVLLRCLSFHTLVVKAIWWRCFVAGDLHVYHQKDRYTQSFRDDCVVSTWKLTNLSILYFGLDLSLLAGSLGRGRERCVEALSVFQSKNTQFVARRLGGFLGMLRLRCSTSCIHVVVS